MLKKNSTYILEIFPDEDKLVCRTLLSWVNDESHHINNDLYGDTNQEEIQNYFNVFKRVFTNFKHEAHFNMIMGDFVVNVEW